MSRLLFTLALAVVAWVISLITGGGRRQVAKIPEGMGILCQPPGKRYVLYALGVVVAAVVAFFSVLYILDGAPEKARPMWALCIAAAILTMVVTTLGGNMMARGAFILTGRSFRYTGPSERLRSIAGATFGEYPAALTEYSTCISSTGQKSCRWTWGC